MSIYNYFKKVEVGPKADDEEQPRVKRKREGSEEEESNGEKRRSEEPLVRIKKPFVDETVVEEGEGEKKNIVKNMLEKKFKDVSVEYISGDSDKNVTNGTKETETNGKSDKVNGKDSEKEKSESEQNGDGEGSDDEEEENYEVESILDYAYCKEDMVGKYFVKWVGWPSDTNTWEPEANLSCTDMLVDFYKTRVKEREDMTPAEKRAHQLPPDPREVFQVRLDFLKENCPLPSKRELQAFWKKDRMLPEKKRAKVMPEKMLNAAIDQMVKSSAPNENKLKWIREQIKIREMIKARSDQVNDLKKWEEEINAIDHSSEAIKVINEADLEGPPRQMQYINAYKAAEGIIIPDDPLIGCECQECGLRQDGKLDSEGCCSGAAGFKFAYTKHNKLRIELGNPIYECNKRCSCGPDCTNRVVQKGRRHKLAIYRTDNGCGWGVKALEKISAGSFVVEYVGEMITSEEAEERGKKYDAEGRTYLFDLDFNLGDENLYTVDAAFYGNISHFINHSCDANLNIFNVYVDCLDPNMPRLCLFAKREIKKGEQITFDYRQCTGNTESKNTIKAEADLVASPSKKIQFLEEAGMAPVESNSMECRCGAANCRKILF